MTLSRLPGFAAHLVALLVVAAGTGGPVDAQEPQRGETLRDRTRIDYDGVGLRAGGFLIFPALEAELRYDDNIYREDRGKEEDFITTIRPEFHAISQWSNHEFRIDAGIDADRYASNDAENTTDWFATASARLDATRGARLSMRLNVEELHEDRGNPNTASYVIGEPVAYIRREVGLGAFYRLNRLSLTADGNFGNLIYDDVKVVRGDTLRQNNRNRDELEVAVRAGYEIVPEYEAFLRATGNQRTYERPQPHIGSILRDSRGWELVAGTALDLGGVIFGEVFAGALRQSYDTPELPPIEGLSVGGSLDWNVTPLTTVSGSLKRTVEESTLAVSGFLSTEFRIRVDHELLRNLIVGGDLAFIDRAYEGITEGTGREDELYEAGVRATWLLNRNFHADFGYRSRTRNSSAARNDYDNHVTTLTLRIQY